MCLFKMLLNERGIRSLTAIAKKVITKRCMKR